MDKYDLWNRALAIIPHDRRVSADRPDTTEHLRCADAWDAARRHVLASHEWGWATRAMGHAHGGAHGADARFTFARPPDALRVVGLFDRDGRRVRADTCAGFFRASSPVVELRYIPDLGDDTVETWPPWFAEAVAYDLARRISPTIKGMSNSRQLETDARAALEEAKRIDASEVAWSGTDGKTFARARR